MAKFFIDRPIFAWVIAILIMLAGALSIASLPVAQYPAIAPPTIGITAVYPGADAKTLEDTVTQVIEQKMNGIDNLRDITSESNASGMVSISLSFEQGTDPDIAQVQVQNKLATATPLLPQEVQRQGLLVRKTARNFLQIFSFVSTDGAMRQVDIADYIASNIVDPISRVPGVGETQLFGSSYAMRIWLDPAKLTAFNLTPTDVAGSIQEQNTQVSAGQLGGMPAVEGTTLNATITAQSRLSSEQEFRDIMLRVNPDGSQVRLGDVARVQLTGESRDVESFYNKQPAAALGVKLAAGANAMETASAVHARLDELSAYFPPGLVMETTMDNAPVVRQSISSVVMTLLEALVLVFLVMFLFLQNFRATLIPTIAAPVVLLGTFGVLAAMGFTINTLTMFGLVLAIGLLVDDAIVVVENVERVMAEEGLSPKEATRKSMGQITSALFGVTSVLIAVFIPMAFFGGSVGVIYRQFSVAIVSAMSLSLLVALTLTPAMCATMLKPAHHGERKGFFGWFNRTYEKAADGYGGVVQKLVRHKGRSMLSFGVIVALMAVLFVRLPSGFLPAEDQGEVIAMITLPSGSTLEQTREVSMKVADYFLEEEKDNVRAVTSINGFNFGGRGQNNAMAFIRLNDWGDREEAAQKAQAIAARASRALGAIGEALVFSFTPPAIPELGTATGIEFQLQARGGQDHDALMDARNQLLQAAGSHPALTRVRPGGQEDTAQYKIDIDQEKASTLGLSLAAINQTLASAWGGMYVNDFVDRGRVKKVYLQADAPFRMTPEDLELWFVRNNQGEMVPFSAFATGRWTYGSPRLERYQGMSSMAIQGEANAGYSTGEAMAAIEELAEALPPGFAVTWTGLSFEERLSGAQTPMLYSISLLIIFLLLAALYESWSVPFSVMMVVPLGVIGALGAAYLFGLANDVYFQIGLLTTVGLSAKNAILIVEFARDLHAQGKSLIAATLEAARMRLRPIIMTSMAFILGVVPLAISSGAGAGGQNAIGLSVIGGMISGTVLAVLFVPVFYVVIVGLFRKRSQQSPEAPPEQDPATSDTAGLAPALEGGVHG